MQNPQVGVAHLGSGFIADYHLEGLRLSGMARVQCVTGRSLDKLQALAQKYSIPNVLSQWRDVLKLPDVQAVVIATPDHLHEEMAIACLQAGKAVMLQKPMAGSVQSCLRIVEQSITQNVDLQVSFMHRYFEEFQHAKHLVADGVIGQIHSIRMRNATPGPDWGDWFFDQANVANGVVDQLGVHGIDLLIQLLGPMHDVSARSAIQKPTRLLKNGNKVQVNVPDTVMANYEFKCGTLV
ncbi:MAG: gfo/Idh/MocA family oxidoreductase, partial [Betaproteobacteria bacterium]|nr:gfo/Idh/MocA family oxidoreductase [Betaproteobacteria bacterium]